MFAVAAAAVTSWHLARTVPCSPLTRTAHARMEMNDLLPDPLSVGGTVVQMTPSLVEKPSTYTKETLERHEAQYNDLRVYHPMPNVCDVYVRAAGSDTFWYVGKSCARDSACGDDGPVLSVVLQKHLMLEHSKRLQPRELGGAEQLELWCAPPNGMVAEQDPQGLRSLADAAGALELTDVGFLREQYGPVDRSTTSTTLLELADDGSGFCVRLRPDGNFPLNCPWLCLVARDSAELLSDPELLPDG